ncbi:hypothetical protein KJ359_012647 [Pestalotiopsis sp. 9143b]|nr:hypothetical protein KJ359_012647 [Pestalotiopsis sp. 9143b]
MAATRSSGRTGNATKKTDKKTDKKAGSSSKAASTKKPAQKTDSRQGRVAKASKKPTQKGKGVINNPINDKELARLTRGRGTCMIERYSSSDSSSGDFEPNPGSDDFESDSSPNPGSDDFESDSSPDPGSDDIESEDSGPTQAQIQARIDDRDEKVRLYRANRARELRDKEYRDSVERRLRELEASACRCQEEGRNGCNCAGPANEPGPAGLQRELARIWQSIQQLETTACRCDEQGSGGCGCSGEAPSCEAMEVLKGEITLIWETITRMRDSECHCDEQDRGGCGCSGRDIDDAVYRAVNDQIAGLRENVRLAFEQLDELSEDLVNVAVEGRQALDEAINHIEELEDENNVRRVEAQDMLARITMLEARMNGLAVAPTGVPPATRPENSVMRRGPDVLSAPRPDNSGMRRELDVISAPSPHGPGVGPRPDVPAAHLDPHPRSGVLTIPTVPSVCYPPSIATPAGPSQAPQTPVKSEGSSVKSEGSFFKSEGSSPPFKSEWSSPPFKSEWSSPAIESEGSSPPFKTEGSPTRATPGGPDRTRHTGNRWAPYPAGAPPSRGRPQHRPELRSPTPVSSYPPPGPNVIVCGGVAPKTRPVALGSPILIAARPNEPGSGNAPANNASSGESSSHSELDSSSSNSSSKSSSSNSPGSLPLMESSTGSRPSNGFSSDESDPPSSNSSSDGSYVPSSGSSSNSSSDDSLGRLSSMESSTSSLDSMDFSTSASDESSD